MRTVGRNLFVAILATAGGCIHTDRADSFYAMKNQPAPGFQLPSLDGGRVRLEDFKGKPIVLAFFAYG